MDMKDWLPIEDAPKNKPVLLCGKNWSGETYLKEPVIGQWNAERERWETGRGVLSTYGIRPTHFQYLPEIMPNDSAAYRVAMNQKAEKEKAENTETVDSISTYSGDGAKEVVLISFGNGFDGRQETLTVSTDDILPLSRVPNAIATVNLNADYLNVPRFLVTGISVGADDSAPHLYRLNRDAAYLQYVFHSRHQDDMLIEELTKNLGNQIEGLWRDNLQVAGLPLLDDASVRHMVMSTLDSYHECGYNPITLKVGRGVVVWGQQTIDGIPAPHVLAFARAIQFAILAGANSLDNWPMLHHLGLSSFFDSVEEAVYAFGRNESRYGPQHRLDTPKKNRVGPAFALTPEPDAACPHRRLPDTVFVGMADQGAVHITSSAETLQLLHGLFPTFFNAPTVLPRAARF